MRDERKQKLLAREARIVAALCRADLTQVGFARRYGLNVLAVSAFIKGRRVNNLDVAAAFEDIGFRERRRRDGSLVAGPRIERRHAPKTDIGRRRFGETAGAA